MPTFTVFEPCCQSDYRYETAPHIGEIHASAGMPRTGPSPVRSKIMRRRGCVQVSTDKLRKWSFCSRLWPDVSPPPRKRFYHQNVLSKRSAADYLHCNTNAMPSWGLPAKNHGRSIALNRFDLKLQTFLVFYVDWIRYGHVRQKTCWSATRQF